MLFCFYGFHFTLRYNGVDYTLVLRFGLAFGNVEVILPR